MVAYNNKVWFGTRAYMQWVPAPAVNVTAGKQGFATAAQFMGGGAYVRRSKNAAKSYDFGWNLKAREEIQPILDYADGMYGDGFIYYVDPFAMDRNVFPAYFAAPYINAYDGPFVLAGTRPTLLNNAASTNGYPVESAVYTVTNTGTKPSVYIPIPEDHTLYVGAHASVLSGNASVTATPWTSGVVSGTTVNLTLLPVNTSTRTNISWSAVSGVQGVSFSLASTSTGVIQLNGMIAQIAPDGAVLPSGGFILGQGTSGMSFTEQPFVTQYSAALDKIGVSAALVETEASSWR